MSKEALKELLPRKRGVEFYAESLGVSEEQVKIWKKEIKAERKVREDIPELQIDGATQKKDLIKGTYEISAYYKHPPSEEDIIKDHKVDMTKYKLSSFYTKGQGDKGWLVTSLFRNITKEEESLDKFQEFLKGYKSSYKPDVKHSVKNTNFTNDSCMVLSLTDFHIGKLDRVNVPTKERVRLYKETVENLLLKTFHSHNIDEIVFVTGNDMYQTDTVVGTTVKLTKVSESETWDKAYEIGFDLLVEVISKLKQYCNKLTIVHVPGNHSESKEYYLAHALEVFFKSEANIVFNRTSDKYKCHVYGETALYFSHGDSINDKLPLMFSQSFYKEWGQTKYKEILLGDKHHNSEKILKTQGEAQGVRMRILPTICGVDQWHYDNLFTNSIQAGIALVYDKIKGKCSEFEHRI